jgi:hypothetical protein
MEAHKVFRRRGFNIFKIIGSQMTVTVQIIIIITAILQKLCLDALDSKIC